MYTYAHTHTHAYTHSHKCFNSVLAEAQWPGLASCGMPRCSPCASRALRKQISYCGVYKAHCPSSASWESKSCSVSTLPHLVLRVMEGVLERQICNILLILCRLSSGSAAYPSNTCQPQYAPLAAGLPHAGGAHGLHGYRPGLSDIQNLHGHSRGWRSGQ